MLPLYPKYYIIKQQLTTQINSGILAPEDKLPSENKLMQQFDVSRITVRKALDELAMEGLIYRIQGKGTYVKGTHKSVSLSLLKYPTSCSDEIRIQHMSPERRVLEQKIYPCDPHTAKRLGISESDPILSYVRIYLADGTPANLTRGRLVLKYLPGIEDFDLKENSLNKLYINYYKLKIVRGDRVIECFTATHEQAALLNIPEGHPLLHISSTINFVDPETNMPVPLETSDAYYNTDIFKLIIEGGAEL